MDDLEPFESPKLLIEGARTSIDAFETLCNTFITTCTYDIVQHVDPKTRERVVKLRFRHRIPRKMRIPASHALNDLRHALDQATVHSAVLLGCIDKRRVFFPFGKSAKDLDDQLASRCKEIHPELRKLIRAYNSFSGGDDLLYALSSLTGPNKHQDIVRISLDNSGMTIGHGFLRVSGSAPSQIGTNKWNDLRSELEFMRLAPQVEANIDIRPVIQIVIGTGEPPISGPAPTVLKAFLSKVENIVLAIEAGTARLLPHN